MIFIKKGERIFTGTNLHELTLDNLSKNVLSQKTLRGKTSRQASREK